MVGLLAQGTPDRLIRGNPVLQYMEGSPILPQGAACLFSGAHSTDEEPHSGPGRILYLQGRLWWD